MKNKNIKITKPISQKIFIDKNIKMALEKAAQLNQAVLLIGDTGTGKTTFVNELAIRTGNTLIRINLTGQTGVDELIGKYLANQEGTYWVDGLLIQAMKNGWWVVLDEINMALPEILSKLHSLLDDDRKIILNEKEGEIIEPDDNFRLFATMNPSDEYAGTKELNKAFISRFPIVLSISYTDREKDILIDRCKLPQEIATELIIIGKEIRQHKEKEKLTYCCSTRDLISCGSLITAGLPKNLAIEIALINKAPKEEQSIIAKLVSLVTGNKIIIEKDKIEYTSLNEFFEKHRKILDENKHLTENIKLDINRIKKQDETIKNLEKMHTNDVETVKLLKTEIEKLLTKIKK